MTARAGYGYSALPGRPGGRWPNGARLAVVVCVGIESYRFGDGHTEDVLSGVPAPDLVNTAWRDYGNRVGAFRLLDLLRRLRIPPTVLLNTDVYDEAPEVLAAARRAGAEIVGHGRSNSDSLADMSESDENDYLSDVAARIADHEAARPGGWSSPWLSHTPATLDLLVANGYRYLLDLRLDDQPVWLPTANRPAAGHSVQRRDQRFQHHDRPSGGRARVRRHDRRRVHRAARGIGRSAVGDEHRAALLHQRHALPFPRREPGPRERGGHGWRLVDHTAGDPSGGRRSPGVVPLQHSCRGAPMTSDAPAVTASTEPDIPVASIVDYSLSLMRNGIRSQILRGVSLDIRPGEILGLVGESGSGKSVLALSLLGLLPHSAHPAADGAVTVGTVDMLRAPEADRRRVRRETLGAIFQDPMSSLNPTMRIGRQIGEVTHDDAESVRLLETVGVRDAQLRLRVYPHELSGGLRQRVMAAIAVAGRPALVVADEPTTALDVTVQAQLLQLLCELRDDFGCSVLMITHDLGVADQIADRLAVLHHGELVEIGAAAAVVRQPRHDYTRSLLAARLTLTMPRDDRFGTAADGEPDEPATPPAVRIRELRRVFSLRQRRGGREIAAVDGVDLDIASGEALAIVGESGSGKSTLLRIVAGLERPTSGTVTLTGSGGPQMVFQDAGSSLTPWLTVGELLGERLRPVTKDRSDVRARVVAALDAVGLPEEMTRARPGELSGGQRQRVALARATIIPPAVLLCDEPTSALDASLAKNVLTLIRDLRARIGMTVLFVTHDLAVARLMGDRIAVMQHGRVVEIGAAEQVIAAPREEYTRTLLAAVPTIAEGAAS